MSRYERFIQRYGIKHTRDKNDPNKVHLEMPSILFEKMINVLLWKEWWIIFRENYEATKEVWLLGVQHGKEQTWVDFIEEMRIGWFKDMGEASEVDILDKKVNG